MKRETLVYSLKLLMDTFPSKKSNDEAKTLLNLWMTKFGKETDEVFTDAIRIILKSNTFFPNNTEMERAVRRAKMIEQSRIIDEINRMKRLKKDAQMTEEDINAYAWLFSHDDRSFREMRQTAEDIRNEAKAELAGKIRISGGAL